MWSKDPEEEINRSYAFEVRQVTQFVLQVIRESRPDISEEQLKEKISALKLGGNTDQQNETATEERKVQGPKRSIISLGRRLVNGINIFFETG